MNILVVTQYYWPEPFRTNEVILLLQKYGHYVTVLTGQPNYPDGKTYINYNTAHFTKESQDAIDIRRVPIVPRGSNSGIQLLLNYLSFVVSATFYAVFFFKRRQFDVILGLGLSPIFQVVPGIVLSRKLKIPIAIWIQDLWPDSLRVANRKLPVVIYSILEFLVAKIYANSNLILVQSPGIIEPVAKLAKGSPIKYHPNPGDLASTSSSLKTPPLVLDGVFKVVFAGNLGIAQSLETVIQASLLLKQNCDIAIHLIGSGSMYSSLKQMKSDFGLTNLHLHGRFPASDIPSLLDQASTLLVSLSSDPIIDQTIPSKIQTYLALGKPIIASISGQAADIIREANAGFVCTPGDYEELAQTILKMYHLTTQDRCVFSSNARLYYDKNFDPHQLILSLQDHLKSLI